MKKSILILGNGFDLAHGLPTRYSDFLEFISKAELIYEFYDEDNREETINKYKEAYIETWKADDENNFSIDYLKKQLMYKFKTRKCTKINNTDGTTRVVEVDQRFDAFYNSIKNNIWYKYIFKLYEEGKLLRGENWIDFESEISYIIKFIDNNIVSLKQTFTEFDYKYKNYMDENLKNKKYERFLNICRDVFSNEEILFSMDINKIRKRLFEDLENLIYAYEIYLTEFVANIPIQQIEKIRHLSPSIHYVLNFNYTKTFENKYNKTCQICHIHGEAEPKRDKNLNNMVIGIDEYVQKENQMTQVEFAIFKKFIQRIRNKNDVRYKTWMLELNNNSLYIEQNYGKDFGIICTLEEWIYDIYVFGHSLDITDRDILRPIFISPLTRIHIFVKDKESEGELITNILRIIDEDILIEKSSTIPPMFEFIE